MLSVAAVGGRMDEEEGVGGSDEGMRGHTSLTGDGESAREGRGREGEWAAGEAEEGEAEAERRESERARG